MEPKRTAPKMMGSAAKAEDGPLKRIKYMLKENADKVTFSNAETEEFEILIRHNDLDIARHKHWIKIWGKNISNSQKSIQELEKTIKGYKEDIEKKRQEIVELKQEEEVILAIEKQGEAREKELQKFVKEEMTKFLEGKLEKEGLSLEEEGEEAQDEKVAADGEKKMIKKKIDMGQNAAIEINVSVVPLIESPEIISSAGSVHKLLRSTSITPSSSQELKFRTSSTLTPNFGILSTIKMPIKRNDLEMTCETRLDAPLQKVTQTLIEFQTTIGNKTRSLKSLKSDAITTKSEIERDEEEIRQIKERIVRKREQILLAEHKAQVVRGQIGEFKEKEKFLLAVQNGGAEFLKTLLETGKWELEQGIKEALVEEGMASQKDEDRKQED
ncbi:hypothetical protein ACHAQE_007345 [Botrytis cinerea]